MNRIKVLLALLCLSACQSRNSYDDFAGLAQQMGEQKLIVVACMRCGCIIEELTHIHKTNPALLQSYTILGDTNCLAPLKGFTDIHHFSQQQQDSVSVDFHNMLIYNGDKSKNRVTLVKTEESDRMADMLR
jgi:hypothetical protein